MKMSHRLANVFRIPGFANLTGMKKRVMPRRKGITSGFIVHTNSKNKIIQIQQVRTFVIMFYSNP